MEYFPYLVAIEYLRSASGPILKRTERADFAIVAEGCDG